MTNPAHPAQSSEERVKKIQGMWSPVQALTEGKLLPQNASGGISDCLGTYYWDRERRFFYLDLLTAIKVPGQKLENFTHTHRSKEGLISPAELLYRLCCLWPVMVDTSDYVYGFRVKLYHIHTNELLEFSSKYMEGHGRSTKFIEDVSDLLVLLCDDQVDLTFARSPHFARSPRRGAAGDGRS